MASYAIVFVVVTVNTHEQKRPGWLQNERAVLDSLTLFLIAG